MPNHVTTNLFVYGNRADVTSLVETIGDRMDFERIIPSPENMFRENLGDAELEYCEKHGIPNWRDWQSSNWGTKWNAYNTDPVEVIRWRPGDMTVCYRFDTAWACPEPIIRRIAEKWPRLELYGDWVDEDNGPDWGRGLIEDIIHG